MGILGYWETGVEGREGGTLHGESLGIRVSGVGGMKIGLVGWMVGVSLGGLVLPACHDGIDGLMG
jgi:hypothetical protein